MQETRIYDYMIRSGSLKCKWSDTTQVIPISIGMKPRKKDNYVVAYCVLSAEKGGLRVQTFIDNDTGLNVEVLSFELETTIFLPEKTNVFCNGYQSWSLSPMIEISKGLTKPPFLQPQLLKNSGDYNFAEYSQGSSHGWSYTYFEAPIGFTLLGSLDESLAYTKFDFKYEPKKCGSGVIISKDCEGLVLSPMPRTSGAEMPPVKILDMYMTSAPESESFSSYFNLFYSLNQNGNLSNRSAPALAWDSWYALYSNVEENRLLAILNEYKVREIPLDYFIIGQGYEVQVGDWTTLSSNLPGGIERIFREIKSPSRMSKSNIFSSAQINPDNNRNKTDDSNTDSNINIKPNSNSNTYTNADTETNANNINTNNAIINPTLDAGKAVDKPSENNFTKSISDIIKPGITLSPFICSSKSLLFKERKELLARDSKGRLIKVGKAHDQGGNLYLLDLYNIQAVNYIKRCIRTLIDDWGAMLLKLDYLYAAGLNSGKDTMRTRAQAINHALLILRNAAGNTPIIACGVPIGSAIGLFEYCSVAPDLSAEWDGPKPFYMTDGARERESILSAIVTTINRRHLDGKAFSSDLGSFSLRKYKTKLNSKQQEALYKTAIIFGGLISNADSVGTYGIESLEQYRNAIAHRATRFNDKRVLSVEETKDGYHVKYALRNELREDDIIL